MIRTFLKPIFKPLAVAFIGALFTSSAIAAPVNSVATVNMQKLVNEFHQTKDVKEKLKIYRAEIAKENNEKLAEIKKLADKIEELTKLLQDGSIAPKVKQKHNEERKKINSQGTYLENARREWLARRDKAIKDSINTDMKKILLQIQDKVEAYARDNNIDFIYNKSSRGIDQAQFIVFSKDQYDITATLLESLNKGVKKEEPKTEAKEESKEKAETP